MNVEIPLLVYGANGYTGRLIVERIIALGYRPIIGGRNEQAIKALAEKHKLPYKVFALHNSTQIAEELKGIKVLLHCAGPFEHTCLPMVEACLQSGTHYVDITGEIWVFEKLQTFDEAAKQKGIMILPGAGFDVVPSDCLAAQLHRLLPDAQELSIAFSGLGGQASRGTTLTAIENLHRPNMVRKNGVLTPEAQGQNTKEVNFGNFIHHCVSIPWGDLSTAYVSTRIPNIRVYMSLPSKFLTWMKFSNYIRPILRWNWVKNRLRASVNKRPEGPTEEQRQNGRSYFWAMVRNDAGETVVGRLECPEGYTLTALCAVHIALKILRNNFKAGFQTPATAYGKDLILEIEGTIFKYEKRILF